MANDRVQKAGTPNLTEPWDDGVSAYTRGQIEDYIKEKLTEATAGRIGAFRNVVAGDRNNLYGFADELKAQEWEGSGGNPGSPLVLSHVQFAAGGGGGGGGTTQGYTLETRLSKQPDYVMRKGAQNIVRVYYNSYYGSDVNDPDTAPGALRVRVNGSEIAELGKTLRSGSGNTEIDLGPWLVQETNTVWMEVRNGHGNTRTWTFEIRSVDIDLSIDDSYDESALRDGPWALRVRCHGVTSLVHVAVDGSAVGQTTITNGTYDFQIDQSGRLSPGTHEVTIWAESADPDVNNQLDEPLRSAEVRTSFIKSGGAVASVAIGGGAPSEMRMYDTVSVPYFFHAPGDEADVEAHMSIQLEDGTEVLACGTQTVRVNEDRTSGRQEWRFSAMDNVLTAYSSVWMCVEVNGQRARVEVSVREADVTLDETPECKVHLTAAGRSNADSDAEDWHSEYRGVRTCTVQRSANLLLKNGNGFVGDRFVVKSGKSITLGGWRPFEVDFGVNASNTANRLGRTINFVFRLRNCTNTSTKVISCMYGGVGFEVYADHVVLRCASQSVETRFGQDRMLNIGFCIDGKTTHCVNRTPDAESPGGYKVEESDANIAYLYVNGVVTRLFGYGEDSWQQVVPQEIVIGSDDCDIDLYSVRGYDKSLDEREMLANYAFDATTLEEKIAITKRNNVLASDYSVDFAKTSAALPETARCIWEMGRMPTGKKDWVKTNTEFENPTWSEEEDGDVLAPFTCTQHDQALDGTSSLSYPDPYKNWASKYNGTWTMHLSGNVEATITKYSITAGLLVTADPLTGEKEFVHKVNFASSEGIGNVLAMNAYQQILVGTASQYPDILTPQQARQQALGKPVTYRHSLSGIVETGWMRQGSSLSFLSLFNFISNKYSGSLFGLFNTATDGQLWEVEDNVNFFSEEVSPGTWENDKWNDRLTELYYARWPKTSSVTDKDLGKAGNATQVTQANAESEPLRRVHNWLVACNPHLAERYRREHGSYRQLGASVTYGDTTFSQDTPAYRYAKFYAEKDDYLNMPSVMFYFLFCTYLLGTDSMDKNMSLYIRDGKAWVFLRDTDTVCLINNRGQLTWQIWHEWNDAYNVATGETVQIDGEAYDDETSKYLPNVPEGFTAVFNGRLSSLWDCVANTCQTELRNMYVAMRSAGLNSATLIALYNSFRDKWCEALYNVDARGYANTGRFDMAQGDKREVFRSFFEGRQRYFDSKFSADTSKALELRLWGTGQGVALRYATPMYASLNWGAGDIVTVRCMQPGEPALFPSTGTTYNETTFTVYNCDLLTSISTYRPGAGDTIIEEGLQGIATSTDITGLDKCKLLESLELDYSGSSANGNLGNRVCDVGNSIALKRLVVRNCPNVTGAFNLQSEKIEYIDLRDTSASGLSVPENATLTTLMLPATISTLRLVGQAALAGLSMAGYGALTTLEINDCPHINSLTLLNDILAHEHVQMASITLSGINWSGLTAAQLLNIASLANVVDFAGRIRLSGVPDASEVAALVARFGRSAFGGGGKLTIVVQGASYLVSAPVSIVEGESVDVEVVPLSQLTGLTIDATTHGNDVNAVVDAAARVVHITSQESGAGKRSVTITVSADGTPTMEKTVRVEVKTYPSGWRLTVDSDKVSKGEDVFVGLSHSYPAGASDDWVVKWTKSGAVADYVTIEDDEARDGCDIVIADGENVPYGTFTVTATIRKRYVYGAAPIATVSLTLDLQDPDLLMTSETNPKVMAICYAQGRTAGTSGQYWCANADYMTKTEAAAVPDIGTAFKGSNIETFDELQYFTGLAGFAANAFEGCSSLRSIVIPATTGGFYAQALTGCSNLEYLEMLGGALLSNSTGRNQVGYNRRYTQNGTPQFTIVLHPAVTFDGAKCPLAWACCVNLRILHPNAPTLTVADVFGPTAGSYFGEWVTTAPNVTPTIGGRIYVCADATGYETANSQWAKICSSSYAHKATLYKTL